MRKLMLMASMLAMVLLAASPAMAQSGANAEQNAAAGDNSNINQQICQNVLGDIVVVNENEANISDDDTAVAVGGDGGDAVGGDQAAELEQLQAQAAELENEIAALQVALAANLNVEVDALPGVLEDESVVAQYAAAQNLIDAQNELAQVQEQIAAIEQGQVNEGGAGGDAVASTESLNVIAQENNTTINVVQNCIQGAIQTGDIVVGDNQIIVHKDKVEDDAQYAAPEDDAAADDAQYVAPEDDAAAGAEAGAAAGAEAGAAAGAEAEAAAGADDAEADAVAVLPDTGGASLFTLAAGALLVAGGLLARRIVR